MFCYTEYHVQLDSTKRDAKLVFKLKHFVVKII